MPPTQRYLDLLKRILVNSIYRDPNVSPWGKKVYNAELRKTGSDWPRDAHTMAGAMRLENLQYCVETVIQDKIEGDLIETGVWRGGSAILMKAILEVYGDETRKVWLADSFKGLPPPDTSLHPEDEGDIHFSYDFLAVSLECVKENIEAYGLLDGRIRFLEGWFADTLPEAPIDKLAILRLDGDMYGSTWDALDILYPKLSSGGFVIVDDYGAVKGCKKAIHDYRERYGVSEKIIPIDWTGAFWRKAH